MATEPQYPRRAPYFGVRVCRLLHKDCAAQVIGPLGTLLVTFVALQEDACRYRKPVTFYDGQLMPILGVSSQDTLTNARKKAVDAGWLVYRRGKKGTASTYWVSIPAHAHGMEDAPLVDDYEREFDPDSVENIDRIPIESGSHPDRKPIESRSEADASLPKPLPKPLPKEGDPPSDTDRRKFVKPTVEEVAAYCAERGNSINAEKFVDFYESKGWKVGKNPMRDWKASIRTWESRDNGTDQRSGGSTQAKGREQDRVDRNVGVVVDFIARGDSSPLFNQCEGLRDSDGGTRRLEAHG